MLIVSQVPSRRRLATLMQWAKQQDTVRGAECEAQSLLAWRAAMSVQPEVLLDWLALSEHVKDISITANVCEIVAKSLAKQKGHSCARSRKRYANGWP